MNVMSCMYVCVSIMYYVMRVRASKIQSFCPITQDARGETRTTFVLAELPLFIFMYVMSCMCDVVCDVCFVFAYRYLPDRGRI